MTKQHKVATGLILILAVASGFAIMFGITEQEYHNPLPPETITIVEECDTNCQIERRTMEIFERDRNEYLEQSRIKAMTEINQELQDLIYVSPYIN